MTSLSDDANNTFEIFPWNPQLETGIAIIDDQHRNLVILLNKVMIGGLIVLKIMLPVVVLLEILVRLSLLLLLLTGAGFRA